MSSTVSIVEEVKPPLRWNPIVGEFTEDFLTSKSSDPNGPSLSDLKDGTHSVLQEALRILGRCLPPSLPHGSETGLVVGYVQSGKTMSFETVIALARDNCYGLVVVLAGTKNNLRDQSEDRLKRDFGIDEGGDHWYHLSNPGRAQASQIQSKVDAWRKNSSKKSLLITVLKHGAQLDKLTEVLSRVNLSGLPALIIDDESDQASLNTFARDIRNNRVSPNKLSTTYEKIIALRDVLPHHSYLQYTATPQANLLLAQTDLLNPSFSELVTPGDAYTGGKEFFESNIGLVEEIPASDVPGKNNVLKSPPKSLLKALRFFLLVSAQHSLTRKKGLASKDRNRSMMVHPAVATTQHKVYKDWVEKAFNGIKERISSGDPSLARSMFKEEYAALSKTFPDLRPLSELVAALADEVIDDLNCVEVNGTPDAEKKVNWKATKYWILVGGAKLDRGYTVEGLCVTYMPRPLGSSPSADNLQQRARFYGYKKKYLGLCRVFLQKPVQAALTAYVEHEEFVRAALLENRGRPLREWRRDFVLTQLLKPTRPNVIGIDLGRILVENWMVPRALHRDEDAVRENRSLLNSIQERWSLEYQRVPSSSLVNIGDVSAAVGTDVIQNVPLSVVISEFLLGLQVKDPLDAELHSALLIALSSLLAVNPESMVDVFLLDNLRPAYRTRQKTVAIPSSSRTAPMNQYFSNSANTANDRSFFTPGRVSLQLRAFDLGSRIRDRDSADVHDVAWYALYVPASMSQSIVVEGR